MVTLTLLLIRGIVGFNLFGELALNLLGGRLQIGLLNIVNEGTLEVTQSKTERRLIWEGHASCTVAI
jgi:hypothetical protein